MRSDNAKARKCQPVFSGLMKYFPDALAMVAHVSWVGNEQHHPGKPLHWDRSKSTDEYDACARHLLDRAGGDACDSDGTPHMAKVAWRALAALQKECEAWKQEAELDAYIRLPDEVEAYIKRLNEGWDDADSHSGR